VTSPKILLIELRHDALITDFRDANSAWHLANLRGPPVIRTASPSDVELSQAAFEAKWNAPIGLYGLTDAVRQKEEMEMEDNSRHLCCLIQVTTTAEIGGVLNFLRKFA
jgi:hypothetical protein